MGGHDHHAPASGGHGHGHHAPLVHRSVISYEIPEPGHPIEPFKAPDWRQFKVDNAPNLVRVKNQLAAQGLKDPWLRNEVWRFDPQFAGFNQRRTILKNAGTGMKWGLILCAATILLETGYGKLFGKADAHHGHGHH